MREVIREQPQGPSMSKRRWVIAVQTGGDGNGVDKWGEGRRKEKVSVRIIAAVVNHDITPFLMLRPPCLTTLRLPLRLHGPRIPRPLGRGWGL
jgi:hypothetical protein